MGTPYFSEIKIMSFNFAPKGWAFCNGQLLPINQNQALFSLLGTMYGGDGRVTFALPDLRGRVAMDEGNGHTLGEKAGSEIAHTLTTAELPPHIHLVNVDASHGCDQQRQRRRRRQYRAGPDHRQAEPGRRTSRSAMYDTAVNGPYRTQAPQSIGNDGRQPAAREHAALSDPQLHHRAAGRLPLAELSPGSGDRAMQPYLGEIRVFAFSFAPQGWAPCNGQLMPVASSQRSSRLLGTIYGGDGETAPSPCPTSRTAPRSTRRPTAHGRDGRRRGRAGGRGRGDDADA